MAKTLLRANHERVLIALLTVFAAAMIGAAWLYYRLERNAVAHAAVNELTAVVETESAQVGNWRRERLADGRVLQASPLMATAGRALSAPRAEGNDRAELTLMLGRMAREFRYADISLVDADGSVHFRLMSDEVTSDSLKQRLRRKLAGDAIAAGDAILSDLKLDTRAGQALMALAVPVEKRGAIILEIDPANFLYPYLRSWPTPRRTAETLLFRSEGADRALILNQPRDARGKPLLVRMPIAAPRADGPGPSEPLGHYTDYRGEAVMGVFGHVPDSPWDLFAKIDWSEVERIPRAVVVGTDRGSCPDCSGECRGRGTGLEKPPVGFGARPRGAVPNDRQRHARLLMDVWRGWSGAVRQSPRCGLFWGAIWT